MDKPVMQSDVQRGLDAISDAGGAGVLVHRALKAMLPQQGACDHKATCKCGAVSCLSLIHI